MDLEEQVKTLRVDLQLVLTRTDNLLEGLNALAELAARVAALERKAAILDLERLSKDRQTGRPRRVDGELRVKYSEQHLVGVQQDIVNALTSAGGPMIKSDLVGAVHALGPSVNAIQSALTLLREQGHIHRRLDQRNHSHFGIEPFDLPAYVPIEERHPFAGEGER